MECTACPLHIQRNIVVAGEGNGSSGLMIVGEAPGEVEDMLGRPFVGPAGQLLDKILAAANLDRNSVYLTNVVKCRPPNNRKPTDEECDLCRVTLNNEILAMRPRVILCMGSVAANQIIHPSFKITKERGLWWPMSNGSFITATYHPAYLLYLKEPQLTEKKREIWTDIQSVLARLNTQ